jgi:hypothetical protein
MTSPLAHWIKVLVILLMVVAIGCVVLISNRPSGRIGILHQYWSQARIDDATTVAILDAARKDPVVVVQKGQYVTNDRIDLGDRSLKSRFDLSLSDAGTFAASRTTITGHEREDNVSIQGSYEVIGRAITFVPLQGPPGLYPVDGSSLVTVHDDGSMALTAGDKSIVLQRVAPR